MSTNGYVDFTERDSTSSDVELVETRIPIACTFTRLSIRTNQTVQAVDYTYSLMVNGVETALSCTLTMSTTGFSTCAGNTPVSVAADDLIALKYSSTQTQIANFLYGLVCQ
jgi:hypothetical protein